MAEKDPRASRVTRRRRPTRPNIHINIFQNLVPPPEVVPEPTTLAEPARDDLFDEPLVSAEWIERRSRRLDAFEQELRQRAAEIDRREEELEEKEARLEADVYLREDELEARERKLSDLERRLGQREDEIGSYVARLQGGFGR
jgi:septin family protein